MGRGYIVEDGVENYLSVLCASGATGVVGLLIGQSSAQRDFVVMATQTPQREGSTPVAGSLLSKQDLEWTTEHARQVSRMLPGGLSVLGIFMITDVDAKDTLNTLRQLVFGIENLISRGHLWSLADDDITDRITLHINSKTRKTVCRTFDVKDPKSTAKPADWKYQSGVCASWPMVSCSLRVELLVPMPENRTSLEDVEKCLKEGLKTWTQQIESGVCLINGKRLPDDTELTAGQKKNVKQILKVQLLTTPSCQYEQRTTAVVQQCGGSVSVTGAVHARAYLHSNKPKAKLAEKLLKRDVVSTVAVRAQMLLEELLTAEEDSKAISKDRFALPRRVFCPVGGAGPVCVCDYQFSDEGLAEVTDRLKEILDIEAAEQDLDVTLETAGDITETEVYPEPIVEKSLVPKKINYIGWPTHCSSQIIFGVAVASAVALLATAASLLYLDY